MPRKAGGDVEKAWPRGVNNMAEKNILVIDDDAGVCETLADIFKDRGYRVTTVGMANEAIDMVKKLSFNVALIDIKLPDMDGTDLLREFKRKHPEMMCVIITGYSSLQNAIKALEEGASGYFVKPLVMEDVLLKVEEAVEKQSLERELKESHHFIQKITDSIPDVIYIYDLLKEKNVYASKNISNVLGYTSEEFKSMGDTVLGKLIHPDDLGQFMEYLEKLKKVKDDKVYEYEYRMKHKDGRWIWIQNRDMIFSRDSKGIPLQTVGTAADITERKKAEEKIKASLREKEVLLQEIHHRVKNNLQVISSLLKLQSEYIKDKQAFQMFKESQDRVKSMALVHEKLYLSKDLMNIDFKDYIQDLTYKLFRSYGVDPSKIALRMDVKDISLRIDTAIPCGLIINELIPNSLKYAFPPGRDGEIKVALRYIDKNEIELKVKDNGVGLPEDFDFRKTKSLGLHLVTIVAEDQLDGRIKLNRVKGTEFKITFKRGK